MSHRTVRFHRSSAGQRRGRCRRLDSLPMVPGDWPTCGEVVGVAVTGRLDRFQRRHPWAAFPLAVAYKYFDDFGTYLAALLTYYGFVSLFPLLLLLSTILGFVLAGDPRLQAEVLTSAAHQFPVIGGDLAQPKRLGGGSIGLVVGIAGCLYGGLGVAQAFSMRPTPCGGCRATTGRIPSRPAAAARSCWPPPD
jgi:hypothetical protein